MRHSKGLSPESQKLWQRISKKYEIAGQEPVIQVMCETLDRLREAQLAILLDGLVITDRFGEKRPHPAIPIEEKARLAFLKYWRSLALDIQLPGLIRR